MYSSVIPVKKYEQQYIVISRKAAASNTFPNNIAKIQSKVDNTVTLISMKNYDVCCKVRNIKGTWLLVLYILFKF